MTVIRRIHLVAVLLSHCFHVATFYQNGTLECYQLQQCDTLVTIRFFGVRVTRIILHWFSTNDAAT